MIRFIVLDSGPLGLVTHPQRSAPVVAIGDWLSHCLLSEVQFIVPAIVYYKLRRELMRANKTLGVSRLDAFVNIRPDRYLPLSDVALRLAADLWAQARRAGRPTAGHDALDIDVLIAAQVLSVNTRPSEIVIATTNAKHLSQFVAARDWTEIVL